MQEKKNFDSKLCYSSQNLNYLYPVRGLDRAFGYKCLFTRLIPLVAHLRKDKRLFCKNPSFGPYFSGHHCFICWVQEDKEAFLGYKCMKEEGVPREVFLYKGEEGNT